MIYMHNGVYGMLKALEHACVALCDTFFALVNVLFFKSN